VSGSYTEGSTQLSVVLTRAVEGPTSGSGFNASPYDCICDCNWDCIWLKDNISFQVTFFVIESSNWSLIFCVSYSRSSGAMDVDVQKLLEVGPKYCLIVTPTPAALTRLGCSGCPMVVVSTSWRPWATKLPCEACSSKESCSQQIKQIWFTHPTIIIKNDNWQMRLTYNLIYNFFSYLRCHLTRFFHAGHLPLHVSSNGRWRINDCVSVPRLGYFLQSFLFLVLHRLCF